MGGYFQKADGTPMSVEERKLMEVAEEFVSVAKRNVKFAEAINKKDALEMSLLFMEAQKDIMGYLRDRLPEGDLADEIRHDMLNGQLEMSRMIDAYSDLRVALQNIKDIGYGSRF